MLDELEVQCRVRRCFLPREACPSEGGGARGTQGAGHKCRVLLRRLLAEAEAGRWVGACRLNLRGYIV